MKKKKERKKNRKDKRKKKEKKTLKKISMPIREWEPKPNFQQRTQKLKKKEIWIYVVYIETCRDYLSKLFLLEKL